MVKLYNCHLLHDWDVTYPTSTLLFSISEAQVILQLPQVLPAPLHPSVPAKLTIP